MQRVLGPVGDDDLGGRVVQPVNRFVLGDDRGLKLRDAAGHGVAGVAGFHGGDGRLADVLGRIEIGLADAQVIDLAAGGGELLGLGGHGESGGRFQGLQDL